MGLVYVFLYLYTSVQHTVHWGLVLCVCMCVRESLELQLPMVVVVDLQIVRGEIDGGGREEEMVVGLERTNIHTHR